MVGIASGLIHHWKGAVFVPRVTLDEVFHALMHPGTPPPQEDVLQSRVLARSSDSLRVYLRLVRGGLFAVTYDTEHEITFNRRSPTLLTSRSVATRIDQVEDAGKPGERTLRGGDDYGFLWRLNSYWRYTQIDGGVRIELESLTLSREVPLLVRPLAIPMVESVARGSMIRTLEAVSRWLTPGT